MQTKMSAPQQLAAENLHVDGTGGVLIALVLLALCCCMLLVIYIDPRRDYKD